jgi:hypothetical protein
MAVLNLRGVDDAAAVRAKAAAAARLLTLPDYVSRLVALHDAVRARADAGDDGLQAELVALGLETVRR